MEFTLVDEETEESLLLRVRVTEAHNFLEISFYGYGENGAVEGQGSPLIIELRRGIPHLHVFGDINQEAPTHTISLEGAKESARIED